MSGNESSANPNGFGYLIIGNDNALRRNTATDNPKEGFQVFGNGTLLQDNHAQDNGLDGIRIFLNATNNRILANTVSGHQAPHFDLVDDNPVCATNTWEDNTFNTANQGCIQ